MAQIVKAGETTKTPDNLCRGGNSFNCRVVSETADADSRQLGPHERDNPVYCRRCKLYMGCRYCAQKIDELVCLRCHDWATDAAERRHGKMAPRGVSREYTKQLPAGAYEANY